MSEIAVLASVISAALGFLVAFSLYVLWRYSRQPGSDQTRVHRIGVGIAVTIVVLYVLGVVALTLVGDLDNGSWPFVLAAWITVLLVVESSVLVRTAWQPTSDGSSLKAALLRGAIFFVAAAIFGVAASAIAIGIIEFVSGHGWSALSSWAQGVVSGLLATLMFRERRRLTALAAMGEGVVLVGAGCADLANPNPTIGWPLIVAGILAFGVGTALLRMRHYFLAFALALCALACGSVAFLAWDVDSRHILTLVFGMLALALTLAAIALVENGPTAAIMPNERHGEDGWVRRWIEVILPGLLGLLAVAVAIVAAARSREGDAAVFAASAVALLTLAFGAISQPRRTA